MYPYTNSRIITVLFFASLLLYGVVGLLFRRYTGVTQMSNYLAIGLWALAVVLIAWFIRLERLGEGRLAIKTITFIGAIAAVMVTPKIWINQYFWGPIYFLAALAAIIGYIRFMLNARKPADSRLLIPVTNDDTALRRIARGE
jgi:hypothetical protein